MISGVFFILLAEALLLDSWLIFLWLGLFILLRLVYIPRVGEIWKRGLANRISAAKKESLGGSHPWGPGT